MKLMIIVCLVLGLLLIFGCKSIPSASAMYDRACSIGVTAGYVASITQTDEVAHKAIVEIVAEVSAYVPGTNESFTVAWTPIAKTHAERMVAAGKMSEAQGRAVTGLFQLVVKMVDYMFDVRYPQIRSYQELVSSAVKGFTFGFMSAFDPKMENGEALGAGLSCDNEALDWIFAQEK